MNTNAQLFGNEKISKILLKLTPPVMLAQLIQALYNMIDSFFVGQYSQNGLTALSIVYPLQLLMIALAVGSGVGINTDMAHHLGLGDKDKADAVAGSAAPLAIVLWVVFVAVMYLIMPSYAKMNTSSPEIIEEVIAYGRIVCVFSIGLFLESVWSKVHQAEGNMKGPMLAQIAGALVNIVLDPIFIFGYLGMPKLGIAGAALATVVGQCVAALFVYRGACRKAPSLAQFPGIVRRIYKLGLPNILMQSAYTVYIFGLNLILSTFSDQAVTVLGLYYKWQTFYFIPIGAMETCIVPILSFNFAAGKYDRCKKTFSSSLWMQAVLMVAAMLLFELVPAQMLGIFSRDPEVISIGRIAFRIIAISFVPLVTSLGFPVFFQAVGCGLQSCVLTVIRTICLFIPLGYLFSLIGLNYFWLTFPFTEVITSVVGFVLFRKFVQKTFK